MIIIQTVHSDIGHEFVDVNLYSRWLVFSEDHFCAHPKYYENSFPHVDNGSVKKRMLSLDAFGGHTRQSDTYPAVDSRETTSVESCGECATTSFSQSNVQKSTSLIRKTVSEQIFVRLLKHRWNSDLSESDATVANIPVDEQMPVSTSSINENSMEAVSQHVPSKMPPPHKDLDEIITDFFKYFLSFHYLYC
ncbi:unnamed protein product [Gongylonema pulchrum]|uniref:Uncharacterized protein n=1 Tax=Gongylonema pulchrum TaxID=637853 RepID=A0A183EUA5_9BILA|nr:unnamed protein product [Gongylonema pulchrum]